MNYRCDLHIHSCLSPCASLDMSPILIADRAKKAGLDLIALTDHNSARNTPAFREACARIGIPALYGLEVHTAEEIHCIALFNTTEAALEMGRYIYAHLPDYRHDPEKLGDQPIVNVDNEIEDIEERYLGNATDIPFSELPDIVRDHGGLFFPAHIDRPSSSLLSQLGYLPPETGPLLEITPHHVAEMTSRFGGTHTLLAHSDAHFPEQIGPRFSTIAPNNPLFSPLHIPPRTSE